jgi:predicted PurR-regulated permease PerM
MATINPGSTPPETASAVRFRKAFLLLLVAAISIAFVLIIQEFLLTVLLAGTFAALSYPLYRWLLRHLRRRGLAALATIVLLFLGGGIPLAGFLTMVAAEAVQVGQGAEGWFREQAERLEQFRTRIARIPFAERLMPKGDRLAEQFRGVAQRIGPMLMGRVAAATRGTLTFLLQLFILLYAMFFFLLDGPGILRRILYYVPLAPEQEAQLLERFVSVTRATLKGSLLIGAIQGALGGVAFWVAGVPGPAFWGTVMVVLAIIPAVGTALVWIPAVISLFVAGRAGPAIALLAWCVLVVSTVDNFLRPRLIGRDARMSDLLILLSTLGGIAVVGAVGFIVGPIVAALFVTVWDLYGATFRSSLPEVPEDFMGRATVGVEGKPAEAKPASR